MRRQNLESCFPDLRSTPYEVTSPEDSRYNCVAWALGRSDRCWWPTPHVRYYWPDNPADGSLEAFVGVFRSLGYEVCASPELEPCLEKVAIYAKNDLPSHVARQLPSGQWTSKCGDLEDITHDLRALEGDAYGSVAVIMKRPLTGSS